MRVLLVRTHRLGDCLQAVMVLRNLRHAGLDAALVSSASVQRLLGDRYGPLYIDLDEACAQPWDLVVCLHSEPAIIEAWRARAASMKADFIDRTHPVGRAGALGTYLRRLSCINVVDLWTRLAGARRCAAATAREGAYTHAVLQPASVDPHRSPTIAFWQTTVDALAASGCEAVSVVGTTSEQAPLKNLRAEVKLSWLPDLPLPELLRLLLECDLFVTPDTGPMHLAALLGTPTRATFFGRADPVLTGPYLVGARVLYRPLSCAPCVDPALCHRGLECKEPPAKLMRAWLAEHDVDHAAEGLVLRQTVDAANERLLSVPAAGAAESFRQRQRAADYVWSRLVPDHAWSAQLQPESLESLTPEFCSPEQDRELTDGIDRALGTFFTTSWQELSRFDFGRGGQ